MPSDVGNVSLAHLVSTIRSTRAQAERRTTKYNQQTTTRPPDRLMLYEMATVAQDSPQPRSRSARVVAMLLGAVAFGSMAGGVGIIGAAALDAAWLPISASAGGAILGGIVGHLLLHWRRRFLARLLTAGIALAAILTVTVVAIGAWFYTSARVTNVGKVEFAESLAIPPLLEPRIDEDGRKVFDLRFEAGTTELMRGTTTPTWGLNGSYLAPTIRAARGDKVVMNVRNGVDEATTLHWHGMHLPGVMDGGPHQMVEPGETWRPTWEIDQPAATLWFHPHLHHETAEHVYRGVAGMFIIDDDEAGTVPLPDTYGADDIPVIVQDKQFHGDGTLDASERPMSSAGILGDEILVNGTYGPVFEATTTLVRLRLLNASNARVYNLGFTDDRDISVIATDAGLLPEPVSTTRIQLSSGERAEILVRVEAGERAMLRSFGADLGMDFFSERFNGADDTFDLLRLDAADRLEASPPIPNQLVELDALDAGDAAATRSFRLSGGSEINGQRMDMHRIDETVTIDTTEIWEVEAGGGGPHSFHPHGTSFLILDIDGRAPPPLLAGWKDTVLLRSGSTYRFVARFEHAADPTAPFMFHCHFLKHEDSGMMGQFTVAEP